MLVTETGFDVLTLGADGANTCIAAAHPCLTWQHAVNEALRFDVEGGNVFIHDEKIGVRLIDNVVITTGAPELLSRYPRDLIVVD